MGAFLRFTLFVGALSAAAAVGYAVGLSRSERPAMPGDERMTIDTSGSPGPAHARSPVEAARRQAPTAPAGPEAQAPAVPPAVPASASSAPDAPTSIDDILQRQATPAAE